MHRDQLNFDYQPVTGIEHMLVESVVTSMILKRRFLRKMQDAHMNEVHRMSNETLITFPILMKMITQSDRMFHRAMDNLEMMKKARKKESEAVAETEAADTGATSSKKTNNLQENGFVFSPFATRDPNQPFPTRHQDNTDQIDLKDDKAA